LQRHHTRAYNDTTHHALTVGNSATVLIEGQRFKLLYKSAINRGMVDVYLDEVKIATLNEYSGYYKPQQSWTKLRV